MVNNSYLAILRRYRGRDEAVGIIGDKTNLTDLLENSGSHSRDELIKEVMSTYSGEFYGCVNWEKVIGAWGNSPERITIHGKFAKQHPCLLQLNLDHGLITHLPEFMKFLKNNFETNTLNAQDCLAVREEFKQYLGDKIVYRGMLLTEQEVEKARREGIESRFLMSKDAVPEVIENFEANVLSVYFDELVETHFHCENYHSPLVSVSSNKDVAIAVGRHFGRQYSPGKVKEPKEFYLFKLRVPEIDLIYYTDHAVKAPYKLQELIIGELQLHISVNECKSVHSWDRNVESYLMYKINSEEIIEVSKPAVAKSSWNNQVSL